MKHNVDGQRAEQEVAQYLESIDYKIVDTNWKTKKCEVDIIAEKDGCMHFVEVKYRTFDHQGEGYEYITRKKLSQMKFAAEYWVVAKEWSGEYVLSAASVSGPEFDIEFLEQII